MQNKRLLTFVGVAVALVIALPVGWYLISPLFVDQTVDEALPTRLPAPARSVVPAEATAAMEAAMAEPDHEMDEPMLAGDMASMTVLAQGDFYNIAHEGHGRATIYQLADGSRILRFEEFEVLNGPDLHVYLVPVNPVPNTIGVEIPGYADLGKLKGNIGNQNYEIPADLDLAQFKSVVIWCEPFRVPFNAAALGAG